MVSNFSLETEVTKIEKNVLLHTANPHYEKLLKKFSHLDGVTMNDSDSKPELPIHMVMGLSEFTKIKTTIPARIGEVGDPVAEFTKFGWALMSPGQKDLSKMYLTHSTPQDYQQLCSLDVHGIEDVTRNESVYSDFKAQLVRKENYYETGLIWKVGHPKLKSNKMGSLARLSNLLKKLNRDPKLFKMYDDVIQKQIQDGIVERVDPSKPVEGEYYAPHRHVLKETAETSKLRVVNDCSAREKGSPSLNECLETGPPLQNLLWDILVANRFKPVALTGDIKQAFLQVRIREEDRDLLRFHWVNNIESQEVELLRFCRALFGLVQSPFLLGGTLEVHFEWIKTQYPELSEIVESIQKSLYVDDLIQGGVNVELLKSLKEKAIFIFKEGSFELHKWHSNVVELEDQREEDSCDSSTFAKENFGESRRDETKILGLTWDKDADRLSIPIPDITIPPQPTKRGVLKFIASMYDPLGAAAPVDLVGKNIYRDVCDTKLPWDKPFEGELLKRWSKFWETVSTTTISFPRSIVRFREEIKFIDFHVFSDASFDGCAAVLYAVVYQESGISQGLVAAKSRLSKKNTSIPRLELIACLMSANLLENAKRATESSKFIIQKEIAWCDSTVALHWISGKGNYNVFVKNRVEKITSKTSATYRHVPGELNPADVASRGCLPDKLDANYKFGPSWLSDENLWPKRMVSEATPESEVEAKAVKEIFALAIPQSIPFHKVLERFSYWKATRVMSWVWRFVHNTKVKKALRSHGPLCTEEIEKQSLSWVKWYLTGISNDENFEEDKSRLNLALDQDNIFRCYGIIHGDYPIYIPTTSLLSSKIVQNCHLKTFHGGVGQTMAEVRGKHWIPRLRRLCKSTIHRCHGCKRFHAIAFGIPPMGPLPRDRTEGNRAFDTKVRYKSSIQKFDTKVLVVVNGRRVFCFSRAV